VALHMLRKKVGDEKFFQTMHTYTERFAGKNVTTDDFVAVASEVSGQDLTSFFQKWVKDEKLPPWGTGVSAGFTGGHEDHPPHSPEVGPKFPKI